jgi:hypothetical protein
MMRTMNSTARQHERHVNPGQSILERGHPSLQVTRAAPPTTVGTGNVVASRWSNLFTARLHIKLSRRPMRSLFLALLITASVASSAAADAPESPTTLFSNRPLHDPWRISWVSGSDEAPPPSTRQAVSLTGSWALVAQAGAQPLHAAAVEHSHAFQMRSKIHKYASFATLPLFAAEVALGQSIYDGTSDSGGKKAAHAAVGIGITALFGVDTVTGVWNMFGKEGRMDKQGRKLRLVHGLLMLVADVGFVATLAAAPESEHGGAAFANDRATHRNLAIASISVGTAGYLAMLLGNR